MNIFSWLLFYILSACAYVGIKAGGHGGGHHHVKIIVPEIHHTHKHTHTVYKTIHHGGGGDHHSHGGKPFVWPHH